MDSGFTVSTSPPSPAKNRPPSVQTPGKFRSISCLSSPDSPKPGEAEAESPRDWGNKGSRQLSQWNRARAIRSGRRIDRPTGRKSPKSPASDSGPTSPEALSGLQLSDEEDEGVDGFAGKPIYMVSDGTGWTAEHTVNTALGQFEHCLANRRCAVQTHLFSGVENEERLMEVIKQAAKEGALVLYTLADPNMAESAKRGCDLWLVPSTNILGPTTEAIAAHLGVNPLGVPRGKVPLTKEYFRRIEAVEFTIKQDDGALPQNLHQADIILVGVSRTGKTPLAIYLAQKGYKVANVPVVMVVDLPTHLFEIDQDKIFGLTINPSTLQTIRKARAKTLGFRSRNPSNYSEMDHVKKELEHCGRIFAQNPHWPVIEIRMMDLHKNVLQKPEVCKKLDVGTTNTTTTGIDINLEEFGLTALDEGFTDVSGETNSSSDGASSSSYGGSSQNLQEDPTNEDSPEINGYGTNGEETNGEAQELNVTKKWTPNVLHENTPFEGMTFQTEQVAYDFYNLPEGL